MAQDGDGHPVTHRSFVSYIDRTRAFYAAQGYARPYAWAHHTRVPFARLAKPVASCTVGVVTTASPPDTPAHPAGVLRGEKRVWYGASDPAPQRLFTDHLAWDKQTTHMQDVGSFLPLAALQRLVSPNRLGALSPRFYGVPTDYSQRRTREEDAPAIASICREDGVDVALLVPI